MFGLPGETKETAKETIALAKKINPDIAKFHILKPYPGTPVLEELRKAGLVREIDYTKYGIHTPPVHSLPGIDEQGLVKMQKRAYHRFYFRPSKLVHQALRMRSWTRLRLNLNSGLTLLKSMR